MKEILKTKPYSNHPDDHYLSIVLAKAFGKFVTWAYNNQDGGYFWGHYFETLTEAKEDYKKRGFIDIS